MMCAICIGGHTKPGVTTEVFERDSLTLVIKGIPAEVCEDCGEAYTDEATTERLLTLVDEAKHAGVQVDVRRYIAA